MGARVDKAGRDDEVGSVDRPRGAVYDFTDFDDSAVCNRHVRAIAGRSSPIDHGSVLDQQIVRHSRAPVRHSFNLVGRLKTLQKSSILKENSKISGNSQGVSYPTGFWVFFLQRLFSERRKVEMVGVAMRDDQDIDRQKPFGVNDPLRA